jgi:hypothetical protein
MSLNVGDVFLIRNFGFCGTNPHYHIVIFKTANNDIITCFTTSDRGKTYKSCRRDEEDLPDHAEPMTFVIVEPGHCVPVITHTSFINCNVIQMKSEAHYEGLPDFELMNNCKMDEHIIKQVKDGAQYSSTVLEGIKKLLL